MEEMKRKVEDDRRALSAESEQMHAKMDFQVDERVREALEEHNTREQALIQDIDALRLALRECKQELAKTKKDASAAAMEDSTKFNISGETVSWSPFRVRKAWRELLAEAIHASKAVEQDILCRKDLEKEVERLKGELKQADIRLDSLSVDLAQKNKMVDKIAELQRTTGEAQEGLRAANNRFNEEVMRMNADVANAENALEKSSRECRRLEAAVDDAIADKEQAQALVEAERTEVKRLSLAAVSTETALTEANSKVEGLARQLKNVQQRMEASEGLERDLKRLGQEAEEMHQKSHRVLVEKQREMEAYRSRVEEGEALSRKLQGSLAEAEGRALQEKGAAERLMLRVSSLEGQVLEGKAALASIEADRSGILSELTAAREAAAWAEELKAAITESTSREESLRVEMAATRNALEAAETSLERERHVSSETRTDLVRRAEGTEKRCESLQSSTKEVTQKLRDTEQRFHKELEKSKERETEMWAQLQQVSSNFAEVVKSKKEGETLFNAKLGDLEKHLNETEKQLLGSQAECVRLKEAAHREVKDKEAELESLKERLSRKKDKSAAQKLSLEQEIKTLTDKLSEGRVVEEGIREVSEREEEARNKLTVLQNARIAAEQETAAARAEAAGLKNQLHDLRTRFDDESARLREDVEVSRMRFTAATSKDTTNRLEGDLARLTAQGRGVPAQN
ncbi:unnamed protein product [Ectocarpus sp. CCAP 1310/34]|nr:unnamed protein product [Ectocarpus sp. CCAP 1310/34]